MIEDKYKNKDGIKYPHPKSATAEETNYKKQLYGWCRLLQKRRKISKLAKQARRRNSRKK